MAAGELQVPKGPARRPFMILISVLSIISEVPRLFFERHGDWHRRGRNRTHRELFQEFANEEYLRAIKAGPPHRRYERYPSRPSTPEPQVARLETVDEVLPLHPVEGENRSR